jgi:CTP-dependent riboflavin kinase
MKLSIEAKAVLFGAFFSPKSTLTFKNEQSEASPQARKGLEELEAAGFILRTTMGTAETFQLTEAGQNLDRRKINPSPYSFMEKHGKFPMAVPKSK